METPAAATPPSAGRFAPAFAAGAALVLLAPFAPEASSSAGGVAGLVAAAAAGWCLPRRRVAAAALGLAALGLAALSDALAVGHVTGVAALAAGGGALLARAWTAAGAAGARPAAEAARWLLLAGAAALLFHPYATTRFVGGGDARVYAQSLADFLAQLREGHLPVLGGQTAFAPHGMFHPLRTAPAFHHWGGAAALVTAGALPAVAVQNLVIVGLGLATAFSSYLCLAAAVPGHRWTAALFAGLVLTCPGVLSPLFAGDLIASWMTLPWLPPLFLGLLRTVDEPERRRGPALAAVAAAALWLSHPPIAFWCSVAAVPFAAAAVRDRLVRGRAGEAAGFAGLALVLAGYVFVSVAALDLPEDPNLRTAVRAGAIEASLKHSWQGFFRPVSPDGSALLTDLQLSPALWIAALAGLLAVPRVARRSFPLLLVSAGVLLALLLPPAGRFVWPHLPDLVLNTTEKWPSQRFFIVLTALVPFLGLQALAAWRAARPKLARDVALLLVAAAGWSAFESVKFVRRGLAIRLGDELTVRSFLPANLPLPRYSFEYVGALPRHYSHAPVAPHGQVRLLAPETLEVTVANSAGDADRPADLVRALVPTDFGGDFASFTPPPGRHLLLRFEFAEAGITGALQLDSATLRHEYALPSSGEARAFGAAPGNARQLLLEPAADGGPVGLKFIRTGGPVPGPGAIRFEARFLPPDSLPLRIEDLTPLRVALRDTPAGWLETPRIWLPGYAATVDGRPARLLPSPDGQVMVQVPAGARTVELRTAGPWPVRAAFWVTLAAWFAVAAACASPRARARAHRALVPAGIAVLVAAAAGAGLHSVLGPRFEDTPVRTSVAEGAREFVVRFPLGRPPGTVEPLVDLGAGAPPIVLVCVDGKTAQLGRPRPDGTLRTGPSFPCNYRGRQFLEVVPGTGPDDWRVQVNGRLALAPEPARPAG